SKSGSGSGTVTSSPSGINCGGDCNEDVTDGTTVVLTASPASSSNFTSWSGCDSTNGAECTIQMSSAKSPAATFTLKTYSLSVSKDGTGDGTVTSSPSGINCGGTCSASYDHGTEVTLTPTGDGTSIFTGWSGACTGSSSCVVTMSEARSVTATFARVTLSLTKSSRGTVTSNPAGISCATGCLSASANFAPNTSVTLTASGATVIVGTYSWGGACSGSSTTCVVTMDQAKSVTITIT
ncbi:MAG TPA: hypothetical protein VEA19_04390, partial [Actinomycetota bacterium]|nr:hypothetical protein [Actinomycetota bacterium]